jgi:catechol 2,3-dioxygenase-like lactoylglutathione lyase family enzyme
MLAPRTQAVSKWASPQHLAIGPVSGVWGSLPEHLSATTPPSSIGYARSMLRIGSIVWGVSDVPRAVEFWCAALDYRPREEPDEHWAVLVSPNGRGPQLAIKLVTSTARTHRRHHLDLYATDQEAEVERLVGLGARRVEWRYEPDADYVVLADPDDNRFCVVRKPD